MRVCILHTFNQHISPRAWPMFSRWSKTCKGQRPFSVLAHIVPKDFYLGAYCPRGSLFLNSAHIVPTFGAYCLKGKNRRLALLATRLKGKGSMKRSQQTRANAHVSSRDYSNFIASIYCTHMCSEFMQQIMKRTSPELLGRSV